MMSQSWAGLPGFLVVSARVCDFGGLSVPVYAHHPLRRIRSDRSYNMGPPLRWPASARVRPASLQVLSPIPKAADADQFIRCWRQGGK